VRSLACYILRTRVSFCPRPLKGRRLFWPITAGGEPCSLLHSARCDRACPPPSS
jgi:hypothetical protein